MQDFLYSLAFVSISDQKPVPLGVATELIRGDIYFWGSLDGGRAARRRPGGDRLQPVPRQVHQRDHRSGNQMMAVNEQSTRGGASMKRSGLAAVITCFTLIGLSTPALAAGAGMPAPQAKGVKAGTLVTSLGGFRETVSIPVVLSGQTIEIEPGGRQTGRQRHLVPTFIYVLDGTLVTNSEGGRVGVAGAQYHAAGQSSLLIRRACGTTTPTPGRRR